jgi:putative hydrolase of the HAD superfamily
VQYAKSLKNDGWKIFILSNNFKERVDYYTNTFKFLKEFDHLYFSCQTGFIKPDKACFNQILENNNLTPSACYYFDDSKNNVSVAKDLGINAYELSSVEEIKQKLNKK